MSLGRVLYRSLLRLARTHDRHPALKARLIHPRVAWAASHRPGVLLLSAQQLAPIIARALQAAATTSAARLQQEEEERKQEEEEEKKEEDEKSKKRTKRGRSKKKAKDEDQDESSSKLRGWAASVSAAEARWMAAFFRDRDYYLPVALMSQIVREEFRMPVPAAAAVVPTAPAAAASPAVQRGSSAAHSAKPPPSPLAQLTTDAFAVLRMLNKNLTEGKPRKLLFADEDVVADPAFRADVAPRARLLPSAAAAAPADAATSTAVSSSTDASAPVALSDAPLPPEFYMRPSSTIRPGSFLVAHPQVEGTFAHSVILVTSVAEGGIAGVVVNAPTRLGPATLWDAFIKYQRRPNPQRMLSSCVVQDGGPVALDFPPKHSFIYLHRHPALSHLSLPMIDGDYPVWQLPAAKLDAAVKLLASAPPSLSGQTAAASESSADSSSSSATPLTPSTSSSTFQRASSSSATVPFFLPSDIVAFHGTAVWVKGQLEAEVARGLWLVMEGSGMHVFTSPTDTAASLLEQPPIFPSPSHARGVKRKSRRSSSAPADPAATGPESGSTPMDTSVAIADETSPSSDASTDVTSSSPPAVGGAVASVFTPHRPARALSQPLLWPHAMHVHGGEYRHFAYMGRE